MTTTVKSQRIHIRKDRILFNIVSYTLLGLLAFVCFVPFWLIVSASFTDNSAILLYGYRFLPTVWSTDAYAYLFASPKTVLNAYKVSIIVTVIGTFISILLVTMAGYVLNRKDVKYRNKICFYIYFTALFSGGLIPTYLLYINILNLRNNLWALIFSGLLSPFNIILMRNFMKSIPDALIEAARIDGAGDFKIFYAIVLPLSGAGIATITLFVALAYWNNWYTAMLYMTKPSLYPLQYYLYNIITAAQTAQATSAEGITMAFPGESIKMAMAIVATGPILLVYPFVQKYFVKGLTIGAVKG